LGLEAGALWYITWSGHATIGWLLLLAFANGIISAFEIPARQSLVIELVGREGIVVTIGNSSEEDTTFNARTLYAKGAARIYGLIVFEEVQSGRVGARELEGLMQLVRDGKLQAPISLRRNWTELPLTLLELEQREYPGKAVLRISP